MQHNTHAIRERITNTPPSMERVVIVRILKEISDYILTYEEYHAEMEACNKEDILRARYS